MLLLTRWRNIDFGNRQELFVVAELLKVSGDSDFVFILFLVFLRQIQYLRLNSEEYGFTCQN